MTEELYLRAGRHAPEELHEVARAARRHFHDAPVYRTDLKRALVVTSISRAGDPDLNPAFPDTRAMVGRAGPDGWLVFAHALPRDTTSATSSRFVRMVLTGDLKAATQFGADGRTLAAKDKS